MSRTLRGSSILGAVAVLCPGCRSDMSVFEPAGPYAAKITHLTWFLVILSTVVFVGVMVVVAMAVSRNRTRDPAEVDLAGRPHHFILIGGAIIPAIVLTAVFVAAMHVTGLFPPPAPQNALSVKVTGNQWWWEIQYNDPDLSREFVTANEMHIPVGRPVRVTLVSHDVIHSFWVPRLQGKLDVIPGDTNEIRLIADKPGDYRGQCAEYCGMQHANMAFHVVADDPSSYEAWAATQRADAAEPTDSVAARGKQVFLSGPCALCHSIRGTPAQAQIAPDLTHIGSRSTIAAGTLPNTLGNMEAWITNAQSLKPGTKMPSLTVFNGADLRALAVYLESLH